MLGMTAASPQYSSSSTARSRARGLFAPHAAASRRSLPSARLVRRECMPDEDVLERRHLLEEADVLERPADAPLRDRVRRLAADILAVEDDGPTVGL